MRAFTTIILTMFCLKLATARYLLVQIEETDEINVKLNSGFRTLDYDEIIYGYDGYEKANPRIWINEAEMILNTCTRTCNDYVTVSNPTGRAGCKKIGNCRLFEKGWIRGFVRCDKCVCTCFPQAWEWKISLRIWWKPLRNVNQLQWIFLELQMY